MFPSALCFLAAAEETFPRGDERGKGRRAKERRVPVAHTHTRNFLQAAK